jgi:hypothetical protein
MEFFSHLLVGGVFAFGFYWVGRADEQRRHGIAIMEFYKEIDAEMQARGE